MLRSGPRDGGDQSGIVDQLSVVGQQATVEAIPSNGRGHLTDALRGNAARAGQDGRRCARRLTQYVAGEEPGPYQCPLHSAHRGQQRDQLRHSPDQMRSVARHQDSALDRASPGDADIAARQIAQPAVHQLGAPPAGAECEIVLFHQRHSQASGRGVQRDAGAGDAATDHDDVGRLAIGQRRQVGGAARCVQGGRRQDKYPFSE